MLEPNYYLANLQRRICVDDEEVETHINEFKCTYSRSEAVEYDVTELGEGTRGVDGVSQKLNIERSKPTSDLRMERHGWVVMSVATTAALT